MRIELEIGSNLSDAIQTFCRIHCSDTNLGAAINDAFGLNFGYMVNSLAKNYAKSRLEEIIIKVE